MKIIKRIYLPCKFGEKFTKLIFKDWENGKRVYVPNKEVTLTGVYVFVCNTEPLSTPLYHTKEGDIVGFDISGKHAQEFVPKYYIDIELSEDWEEVSFGRSCKLARVVGLNIRDNKLCWHIITKDRYQHVYESLKRNEEITYYEL